jgi:carbonic anhydrase
MSLGYRRPTDGLPEQLERANWRFAAGFAKGRLPAEPARGFAVVTCMDARIDPLRALGLREGDAHVLRNAGAVVTDDVLRSLAISRWLLGTTQAVLVGHTDCGMTRFTNYELHDRLRDAGVDTDVDFLPFVEVEESIRSGLERIRSSELLPEYGATGYVYDVESGRISRVG